MKRKNGFTLIELMVTMAISLIAISIISSILIQGYKIMNKSNNKAAIQDEVRNAIMNIEASAINAKEIKIRTTDAITNYNGKEANEILFIKKDSENIAYIETVMNDNFNTLIEVKLNADETIKSEKILLNNIISDSSKFSLHSSDDGKVVNLNFEGVSRGNEISGENYILTLSKESNKEIIVDFAGTTSGNPSNPSEPTNPDISDEKPSNTGNLDVDFEIYNNWGSGAEYRITLTNNTASEIIAWELVFEADVEFTSCYNTALEKIGNGKYKIKSNQNCGVIEVNKSISIAGQCRGSIDKIKNISIRTW